MRANREIQVRGHCPICGRLHAVPNGLIAHHGYTVPNGWGMFVGGCGASQAYQPLEISRKACDNFCAEIEKRAVESENLALKYESGEEHPSGVKPAFGSRRYYNEEIIPWEEATRMEQQNGLMFAIHQCRNSAKMGRDHIKFMQKLADKVHGKPLVEVKKEAPLAPISGGEKRQGEKYILTAIVSMRGRVEYFFETLDRDGNPRKAKSWMGVSAWRKLAIVE